MSLEYVKKWFSWTNLVTPALSVNCWTEDPAGNTNPVGKPSGQDRVILIELKDQLTLTSDQEMLLSRESAHWI